MSRLLYSCALPHSGQVAVTDSTSVLSRLGLAVFSMPSSMPLAVIVRFLGGFQPQQFSCAGFWLAVIFMRFGSLKLVVELEAYVEQSSCFWRVANVT
jgi:hypothetical protein